MPDRPAPVDPQAVERLHAQLLALLNDPAARWYEQPQIAAATIGAVFTNLLCAIATTDPTRLPWIRHLLVDVADHVAAAVTRPATVPPGTEPMKWH